MSFTKKKKKKNERKKAKKLMNAKNIIINNTGMKIVFLMYNTVCNFSINSIIVFVVE